MSLSSGMNETQRSVKNRPRPDKAIKLTRTCGWLPDVQRSSEKSPTAPFSPQISARRLPLIAQGP
jgi:hypothetical protein